MPSLLNEEVPIQTTTITYNGIDLLKYPNRLTNFLGEAKKDHVSQLTLKVSMSYKPIDKPTARHESETAVMHIYLFYFPIVQGVEVPYLLASTVTHLALSDSPDHGHVQVSDFGQRRQHLLVLAGEISRRDACLATDLATWGVSRTGVRR